MKSETGEDLVVDGVAGTTSTDVAQGFAKNNYTRPSGAHAPIAVHERSYKHAFACAHAGGG